MSIWHVHAFASDHWKDPNGKTGRGTGSKHLLGRTAIFQALVGCARSPSKVKASLCTC